MRNQSAHRLSFILNKGPIPDGLHILHACDNRACFNPAHLSTGTIEENLEDMRRKGRANYNRPYARLEEHVNSKLTVAAVQAIRASPDSASKLAGRYGVSKSAVKMARAGLTWKTAPTLQSVESNPPTS